MLLIIKFCRKTIHVLLKSSQTDSHEQVWLKFLNIIKLLNKVDAKIRRWGDISKFEEDFFDIRVKFVA